MNNGGNPIEVLGLVHWVQVLNGPKFRDIANALRDKSLDISRQLVPAVAEALALSQAPQAAAFISTIAPKRDRVPVVVIGRTNPQFRTHKFTRRGPRCQDSPGRDHAVSRE